MPDVELTIIDSKQGNTIVFLKTMQQDKEEEFLGYKASFRFKPATDQAVSNMFHKLWTKAVGTQDYDKKEWFELSRLLNINCGVIV